MLAPSRRVGHLNVVLSYLRPENAFGRTHFSHCKFGPMLLNGVLISEYRQLLRRKVPQLTSVNDRPSSEVRSLLMAFGLYFNLNAGYRTPQHSRLHQHTHALHRRRDFFSSSLQNTTTKSIFFCSCSFHPKPDAPEIKPIANHFLTLLRDMHTN